MAQIVRVELGGRRTTVKKLNRKKKQQIWTWTKRIAFWGSVAIVVREAYLAFGPRRELRRGVFEAAKRRAQELGKPLLVLGDPDGGLVNHVLGRSWQCGDLCVDPLGCGICPTNIQGRPVDVLAKLGPNSHVIFDAGQFALADDGAELAAQLKRVGGQNVFLVDVEPWSLAAFFEPKRKRRVLGVPQVNNGVLTYKPLPWAPELVTGRNAVSVKLGALPAGGYLGSYTQV